MCTMIGARLPVRGSARSSRGWSAVSEATISYDHATHLWSEHALRIDLVRAGDADGDRVAVELDLASGRALLARLAEVVAAAERAEAA